MTTDGNDGYREEHTMTATDPAAIGPTATDPAAIGPTATDPTAINPVNRIIVMADNEVGVIADITRALAGEGINVESINAQTVGGQGTIILTADHYDRALYVLNQAGFKAVGDDALVLRLEDRPGALAEVADRLKRAGVNIESMHILNRQGGQALIALKSGDRAGAVSAIGREFIV